MERFDVAIIGAGPDGLIAAHRLAAAGLRVVVFDRRSVAGGRAATTEFHPGFRASPYSDEIAPLPPAVSLAMDLPRRGALFMPTPASICVAPDSATVIYRDALRMARLGGASGGALAALHAELEGARASIAARAASASQRTRFDLPWRRPRRAAWPEENWGFHSLAEAVFSRVGDPALGLHLIAHVLSHSAASPYQPGSALHLLRGLTASGLARGGLGSLGNALHDAARAAGADVRLDTEVIDIRTARRAADGVLLAGGSALDAKAVISTLDLKATFLTLLSWSDLSRKLAQRIAQFRMAGSIARVLFALDAPPEFPFAREAPEAALGPIHVVESIDAFSSVHDCWRAGAMASSLPVTLRVPSLLDPSLAPAGKAVMTATVAGVPARLFDAPWTLEKREGIAKLALGAAERLMPGLASRVVALKTVIADDIEAELGLTAGDLDGGELAPDQALGFRPFSEWKDARTPVRNLYLGGPSASPSPFLSGGGGLLAAETVMVDFKSGSIR